MEPKGSLPQPQAPATSPYPQPDQYSPCLPIPIFKIHFNNILPSMPTSSKWPLSLMLTHQNPLCIYAFPHMCYMPPPPPKISFFLICSYDLYLVKSADHKAPRYVVFSTPLLPRPLWSKYLPQHPINQHTQPLFINMTHQVSHPYKRTGKIVVLYILM
jgi:hypothetical protein